jgi:hypothetical protein
MPLLPDRPRRQDLNRDIRARQQPLDPGHLSRLNWQMAGGPFANVIGTPDTVLRYGSYYTARVIKFPAKAGKQCDGCC